MKPDAPMSAAALRKQVLMARIALQRVELGQDLFQLREHMRLPTLAGRVMRSGKLTSALIGLAAGFVRRFPAAGRVAERISVRVPRSRVLFKLFGVAMALWPIIKFAREGVGYVRERRGRAH
jgi:hypothetical protein